jgi:flagellar basal-body rod protein FlgG
MDRALSAAASGMEAEELKMSIIANNLANVNTNGFKKSRAEFQDVLYDNLRAAGGQTANGEQIPAGLQVGQGVRTAGTQRIFSMGDIRQTNHAFDVAIEGDGFFQVQQANGEIAYTRDGALKLDATGRFVTTDGQVIIPQITVPRDASGVTIGRDGTVSAILADSSSQPVELGNLTLVRFSNPAGLEPMGHNLYGMTAASGQPIINPPGTQGTGSLAQGFLEGSNVRAVDEMIDLITTQRAYEMGTKIIQAADQMLSSTSNIR